MKVRSRSLVLPQFKQVNLLRTHTNALANQLIKERKHESSLVASLSSLVEMGQKIKHHQITSRVPFNPAKSSTKLHSSTQAKRVHHNKLTVIPTGHNQDHERSIHAMSLSITLWEFGGQKVYYHLHYMMLTEYACFLLVFNAQSVVEEDTTFKELESIKFRLFSKKTHAPEARIFLVGTHADGLTEADEVRLKVLLLGDFKVVYNEETQSSSFLVDYASRTGIRKLNDRIGQTLLEQSFISELVPSPFMTAFSEMKKLNRPWISCAQAREILNTCMIHTDYHADV